MYMLHNQNLLYYLFTISYDLMETLYYYYFLLCVWMFCPYMFVYNMCAQYPRSPEKSVGFPETVVTYYKLLVVSGN